ncbi:MAG: glycosyltransferase family 9 protein [Candidatus Omnitrophica bacterium]|nr:glycosyltransferase family 9 protein [Candidatus Omnitrophota bacterium]MBU1924887.1 glycosyltransferase family 9 protein [Candidatus Omnitrophota bacterium]
MEKIDKILIINLGGIGDLLLSKPALKALRKKYPQAEIDMLTAHKVYEIACDFDFINRVFVFELEYGRKVSVFKMFGNFRVLTSLRSRKYDVAVNMRTLMSNKSAAKMKLMLSFIKPARSVGRDTEGRGNFFDMRVPESQQGRKCEMEYDIDTVKKLDVEVPTRGVYLEIPPEVEERVEIFFRKLNIKKEDIIVGIHPGGMPSRRWPIENFAEVIKKINISHRVKFIVTGSAEEKELAQRLVNLCGVKLINLAGKLTLKELAATIKKCAVFISNDTGPMHIAAVLEVPLVAIFGPGDIVRFDPRNIFKEAVVLYKKTDCAPCEKRGCEDLRCLKAITPLEVSNAVVRFLGSGAVK